MIIKAIVAFLYLFYVPGYILANIFRILDEMDLIEKTIYSIGLSLSYLLVIVFIVAFIFPFFDLYRPLNTILIINILNIILINIYLLKKKKLKNSSLEKTISVFKFKCITHVLYAIFILLLSILSIFILNTYENVELLLFFVFVTSLLPLAISKNDNKRSYSSPEYPLVILLTSLSLLFSRSLISKYPNGFDIMYEYSIVKLTLVTERLNFDVPDTYASVLATNIIVPVYYFFSNINIIYVFKIVVPLLYSIIVPIAFYKIYVYIFKDGMIAKYSIFLVIFSLGFFLLMPTLLRQQFGEIFLSLMLITLIKMNDKSSLRYTIITLIFGFSMIVSHYTITYIFIISCIILIIIKYIINKIGIRMNFPINMNFTLFIIVTSFLWFTSIAQGMSFVSAVNSFLSLLTTAETDSYVNEFIHARITTINSLGIFFIKIIILLLILSGILTSILDIINDNTSNKNLLKNGYLLLTISVCIIFLAYFGPFKKLSIERYFHILLLFASPYFVIGCFSIQNLWNNHFSKILHFKLKKQHVLMFISTFLMLNLIFNSGAISVLVDDEPIGLFRFYKRESPILTTEDIYGSSFLISNIESTSKVWGDRYIYPIINGGYIKNNPRIEKINLLGSNSESIRDIRYPLSLIDLRQSIKTNGSYIFFNSWNTKKNEMEIFIRSPSTIYRSLYTKTINPFKSILGDFLIKKANKIYDNGGSQIWKLE